MKIGVPGEFHEDRWQRTAEDSERCMIPRTREAGGAHRIHVIAWQRGTSDCSSARPPCPQLPQGHPGVAKSHLTKDKPVSARCKDRLSYRLAYRQTCRMVSYACLTDRQTGLPYRQPYLKLSPAGSHGSSLPDGFIRQTYRTPAQLPDRQTCRMVSYASLTGQPH